MPDINGLPTPDELAAQGYTPAQGSAVRATGNNLSTAFTESGRNVENLLKLGGNAFVGGTNRLANGTLGLFGINRTVGNDYWDAVGQNAADVADSTAGVVRNLQNAVATGVGGTMQPAGLPPVPAIQPPVSAGAPMMGTSARAVAGAKPVGLTQATQATQAPQAFRIPDKYDVMVDKATGATRGNVTLPVPTRTGSVSDGITFGLPPVDLRASPGVASTPFVGLGYNPNNVVDPNLKTEEELLSSRIGQILGERARAISVLSDDSVLGRAQRAPGAVTRAKMIADNATGLAQSLYGVMNTGQQTTSKSITDVATSNADNQTKIADRQLANAALLRHAQITGQYGLLGEEAKANGAVAAKRAEMQSKVMTDGGANAKNTMEARMLGFRLMLAQAAAQKDSVLAAQILAGSPQNSSMAFDPNGGAYQLGYGASVRVPTPQEIKAAAEGKK